MTEGGDKERKSFFHYFFSIDEIKPPNGAKHAVSSCEMLWLKNRIRYDGIVYLSSQETYHPLKNISKFSEGYNTLSLYNVDLFISDPE